MDSKHAPRPHPDVIWRVLDGEAVLVSPRAGHVRVLNEVGSTIWSLLDGRRTIEDIEHVLTETYGVDRDVATADIQSFLRELALRGLLAD